MNAIHFLLTPDRSSSRLVKRMAAENASRLGVIVGTWTELMEAVREAYVLPDPPDIWNEKLTEAASSMTGAFWAGSLKNAAEETRASIGASLTMLIEGAGPSGKVTPDTKNALPERAGKHLVHLSQLHETMGNVLPVQLAKIRAVLDADKANALRPVVVYHVEGLPKLSLWQKALIDKLEKDFLPTQDKILSDLLTQALAPASHPNRPKALAAIQDNLFNPQSVAVEHDNSVQCLAVRDYLEEAEVAAGMVQTITKDQKLKLSDVGLLVPSDVNYARAISQVFTLAGITLSGLDQEEPVRDLGREAVLLFLICRKAPAPVMALASLFTSPLMPWTKKKRFEYASLVMSGKYEKLEKVDAADRDMMSVIREENSNPAALSESIDSFVNKLSFPKGWEKHKENAKDAAVKAKAVLQKQSKEIIWKDVIAAVAPAGFPGIEERVALREGVSVLSEGEEPWRKVSHLIVLGFSAKRYPQDPPRSSVFSGDDLVALRDSMGYAVETPTDAMERRRALFKRQVRCASDSISLLQPKRDAFGKPIQPSSTLTYMSQLFDINTESGFILDLDTESGKSKAKSLARADEKNAEPLREIPKKDLNLKSDLLLQKNGTPRVESPSAMETIIMSPFAWFLDRNGLTPDEWSVEMLDPAAKGNLAHEVFEHLFKPGDNPPSENSIKKDVPGLLDAAVRKIAPMLRGVEWKVEYANLANDLVSAAIWWSSFLTTINAKVAGVEVWLEGKLGTLPMRGKSDVLLLLPEGRLVVADYKKSKSNNRRIQMRKGWDSQANLYKTMIQTGGVASWDTKQAPAVEAIKEAKTSGEIGVLYYMMNDHKVLAETGSWFGHGVAGAEEFDENISVNAMQRINQRIDELRKGVIMMNRSNDEKTIKKESGMTASYAIDKSPLIKRFMINDLQEETEE